MSGINPWSLNLGPTSSGSGLTRRQQAMTAILYEVQQEQQADMTSSLDEYGGPLQTTTDMAQYTDSLAMLSAGPLPAGITDQASTVWNLLNNHTKGLLNGNLSPTGLSTLQSLGANLAEYNL